MNRPPRRMIINMIGLLMLGAIINIAVAWTLVIAFDSFAPGSTGSIASGLANGRAWTIGIMTGKHDSVRVVFQERDPDGRGKSTPSAAASTIPNWSTVPRSFPGPGEFSDARHDHLDVASGWPARSLHVHTTIVYASKPRSPAGAVDKAEIVVHRYGIATSRIDASSLRPKVLPLAPIWPGFLINTLLYAAMCWLPFAPLAIRRTLRRRRKLCLNCGYPTWGGGPSPVCTECGAALPKPLA